MHCFSLYINGTDFSLSSVSSSLTFTTDSEQVCADITIVDDSSYEGDLSFSVQISSTSTDENVQTAAPSSTTITILEDDGEENSYSSIISQCIEQAT